jgi:hypothetical protein
MNIKLAENNILNYLIEKRIYSFEESKGLTLGSMDSKNINFRIISSEGTSLLVKQEREELTQNSSGEILAEWKIQELLNSRWISYSELQASMSEAIYYDAENSILILKFFREYCDVAHFHQSNQVFPPRIASTIGKTLGKIHRETFHREDYRLFFYPGNRQENPPNFLRPLHKITPEVFGVFCADGIEFFRLFQRHQKIKDAIADLSKDWKPCCLIHGDFRLYNILIHEAWETMDLETSHSVPMVKVIDWERGAWGDPCLDIATILGNYLSWWLDSMVVHPALPLDTVLQTAKIPLDMLRPTLSTLITAYLEYFPEILHNDAQWFLKTMKFTGLYLIERILAQLEEHEPFDNTAIVKLQVAKVLLCDPAEAIQSIFGCSQTDLMPACYQETAA